MFLGLYEHVIRFPGVEQEAWSQRMLPSLSLRLPASLPLPARSRVQEARPTSEFPTALPSPRSAQIRPRRLLARGAALLCLPLALFAWYWLRRDTGIAAGRLKWLHLSRRALPMHPSRKRAQWSGIVGLARQRSQRARQVTRTPGDDREWRRRSRTAREQQRSNQ